MKISAELKYLRMTPRKVRLVANVIRGKSVPEAERALKFLTRRAVLPLEKLLRSAVANAKHNFQVTSPDSLRISEILVNEGPTLKRRRFRAMGRAFPVRKRTRHVRLVLETTAPVAKPVRKSAPALFPAEQRAEVPSGEFPKATAERGIFRARPKIATKPTDFVRRMFRRKAI